MRAVTAPLVAFILAWGLAGIGPAVVGGTTVVRAASPEPTTAVGDPRSEGEGPGLVGEPAVAILAVIGIGLASVLVTIAWVRLTKPPDPAGRPGSVRRRP